MKADELLAGLDKLYPDGKCELEYKRDYELLIATVLSAQCTDKRVNMVTQVLFKKYDIFALAKASVKEIGKIIYPVGTYTKKSKYIITIAQRLVKDYGGKVPNDRAYLESLPGVGRKTCNVVLANIYNVPAIAVDTHVARVAKRLKLAKANDDVLTIEKKLMKFLPKERWSKAHHQLVLFGRYICKSQKPDCLNCLFQDKCPYFQKNKLTKD